MLFLSYSRVEQIQTKPECDPEEIVVIESTESESELESVESLETEEVEAKLHETHDRTPPQKTEEKSDTIIVSSDDSLGSNCSLSPPTNVESSQDLPGITKVPDAKGIEDTQSQVSIVMMIVGVCLLSQCFTFKSRLIAIVYDSSMLHARWAHICLAICLSVCRALDQNSDKKIIHILHSLKILMIQQGITRGVSSVGKPCRP